jgi:hypothetical protein
VRENIIIIICVVWYCRVRMGFCVNHVVKAYKYGTIGFGGTLSTLASEIVLVYTIR